MNLKFFCHISNHAKQAEAIRTAVISERKRANTTLKEKD